MKQVDREQDVQRCVLLPFDRTRAQRRFVGSRGSWGLPDSLGGKEQHEQKEQTQGPKRVAPATAAEHGAIGFRASLTHDCTHAARIVVLPISELKIPKVQVVT